MIKCVSFLIVLIYSPFVFSQELVLDEPKVTTILKGKMAPFDGTLLNSSAVANIMVREQTKEKEYELNKQLELDKMKNKYELEIEKRQVEMEVFSQKYKLTMEMKTEENKRLQDALLKSESNNNKHIWWMVGGVAGGIVLTLGASLAIYYSTNAK